MNHPLGESAVTGGTTLSNILREVNGMPLVMEHTVLKHIKVVCILEGGLTDIYGDLPGLPSCFDKLSCISIGSAKSCLSNWIELQNMKLRFMISTVFGEDRVTGFQVVSSENLCSKDPESIVLSVLEVLGKLCEYDASSFIKT